MDIRQDKGRRDMARGGDRAVRDLDESIASRGADGWSSARCYFRDSGPGWDQELQIAAHRASLRDNADDRTRTERRSRIGGAVATRMYRAAYTAIARAIDALASIPLPR